MGNCLAITELVRDMRRAQRDERGTRVIVNFMVGTSFTGPMFNISTRQNEPKERRKEKEDVEVKAIRCWAEKVKPTGQFLDVEDTTEFPCVVCGEDAYDLKTDNKVVEFIRKLQKEIPKGIQGCIIQPELPVEMGCCHQTIHVGCLLTWWMTRSHWTCPHCREVYLEGNKQQSYPTERQEGGIVNQVFDAVTRTIWDLDTRPDPYVESSRPIVIDDSDSEDDEFEEDDRFEFTDILDDDLSTLEELLGR